MCYCSSFCDKSFCQDFKDCSGKCLFLCGSQSQSGADGTEIWRKAFTELRGQLRQMLYEKDVQSNPGVGDQWIVDELRKLLDIEDSPHRFLNFPG